MNNRIQQFIDAEHLTPAKLADSLNVQRSNISHILSGRNKPGFEFIEKILKRFSHLNPDWLILGKGNMYRDMYTPSLFPTDDIDIEKENPAIDDKLVDKHIHTNELGIIDEVGNIQQPAKTVERVMVFYTNNTFDTYIPSKNTLNK